VKEYLGLIPQSLAPVLLVAGRLASLFRLPVVSTDADVSVCYPFGLGGSVWDMPWRTHDLFDGPFFLWEIIQMQPTGMPAVQPVKLL
jgi:hypothetical protein